jgi:hypothetical protein
MSTNNARSDFVNVSPFGAPPPAVIDRIRLQPECRLLWAVLENAVETRADASKLLSQQHLKQVVRIESAGEALAGHTLGAGLLA